MAEFALSRKIQQEKETTGWLTVGEASALLLVSSSTLRRWTEQELVPVRKTPGGHRRYSLEAVRRLAEALGVARSEDAPAQPSAALSPEWGVSHEQLKGERWYGAVARPENVSYMRSLGQRLLGLLIQHVSRTDEDPRFLEEATEVGVSYGQQCARYQAGLRQMLDAFVFFRRSFSQTVLQLPRTNHSSDAVEIVRLARLTDTFMDAVLSGIAEGYEHPAAVSPPDRGGERVNVR